MTNASFRAKGDLLYSFPSDVRQELAARSNAAKVRDAWNSAKPVLQTVGRVSFGLALFGCAPACALAPGGDGVVFAAVMGPLVLPSLADDPFAEHYIRANHQLLSD